MSLLFRIIPLILFFLCVFVTPGFSRIQKFKAAPDQVLVLYNKDYTIDVDGSDPIQDSEEVARYFVRMHTDAKTGKKPYLLGLQCRHGKKHLNHWVIKEKSDDNKNGVRYKGRQKRLKGEEPWYRDSRYVEILVRPRGQTSVDWDSVQMTCESIETGARVRVAPDVSGIPTTKKGKIIYPQIQEGKGRCFRFNAKSVFSGTVRIYFKIKALDGRPIKDLRLTYHDIEAFEFTALGKDNVSDELHFQEDVAIPVKRFLEDKKNRLPDDTLLKDHILYMVVCHGLPFSCEGAFGIERGATSKFNNHGDIGSLEQRLQTLYYGWGKQLIPPVVSMYLSGGPDSKDGVRNHRITTALRYPLGGRRWNPYMHPDTYSFLGGKKEPVMVDMSPLMKKRKELPSHFFAYGVSRVDGQGPVEAKRQIDYAVYASRHLRPEMDLSVRKDKKSDGKMSERLALAVENNAWGATEQKVLGFKKISSYGHQGIPFLARPLEDSTTGPSSGNAESTWSGYYPGGMDRGVYSGNGWNMGRGAAIWKQVDQGVTLSACGGPAYGGGPHITNATFWDNRIMLRYLFRGRDLGECFLMSTFYVNWSTSLVGDPLFHPDLNLTVKDTTAPRVGAKSDIQVTLVPAMGEYAGQIDVSLVSTAEKPEVATLEVYYRKKGASEEMLSRWPIYSTRPKAVLRHLEPNTTYICRLVLTDPYGNVTDVSQAFGDYQFKTGGKKEASFKKDLFQRTKKGWHVDLTNSKAYADSGTIEVAFSSREKGGMPVIRSKDINVGRLKGQSGVPFQIGGHTKGWSGKMDLPRGENITMILRWRKFPLTRELLFRAKNGNELTYASDVRTPWVKMALKDIIRLKESKNVKIHSARIYADAYPASDKACAINVEPFDQDNWKKDHL